MFTTQPKIFISSTIWDLPNERTAAYKAVNKVGGFPMMSEKTIEAQSSDSLTVCLNKVKECDIYVLIVGGRYGWQPEGNESITELEYLTALNNKKAILVFNTAYDKEKLQKDFFQRVETKFFRKTVSDAFELESEIEKSLITEIDKKQKEYFNKTELIYANLVKIELPKTIYIADLALDIKAVKKYNKENKKYFKKPSSHDYAVSALYMNGYSFPHDWIVWNKKVITFHNLHDNDIALTSIIDQGTIVPLSLDEFYSQSDEQSSQFKYLLKKCLEAKLHKQGIRWIRDNSMFAFIPIDKNDDGEWQSRSVTWTKKNKATRKVVDVKLNLKDNQKVFNMKCLAFRTHFECLDNEWYIAIKPEWIFLWSDLKVCDIELAQKNIQWLKRNERNMHVFNNFNFILHFLQPKFDNSLFDDIKDYPFIKLKSIEKFDFAPIIPDDTWSNLEDPRALQRLSDTNGEINLFTL